MKKRNFVSCFMLVVYVATSQGSESSGQEVKTYRTLVTQRQHGVEKVSAELSGRPLTLFRGGDVGFGFYSDEHGVHWLIEKNGQLQERELFSPIMVDRDTTTALPPPTVEMQAKLEADDPIIIHIAIFIDDALDATYGSEAIRSRILSWVSYTNAAFATNGIALTLEPSLISSIEIPDGLFIDDVLDAVFPGQLYGDMNEELQLLRNGYGFDLISIVTFRNDSSICAKAFHAYRDEDNLFGSTIGIDESACPEDTFAHEIGHNLGGIHDRADYDIYDDGEYNYAYQCGGHGTILNVNFYPRHDFFSSPELMFGGEVCGIEAGQSDAADNARTIRESMHTVAAYMEPMRIVGSVGLLETGFLIDDERNVLAVALKRDGDLSERTSVELTTLDGSALAGQDFTHFMKRVEFAAGEASAEAEIGILNLQRTADKEFTLVLRWPEMLEITEESATVTLKKNTLALGQIQFPTASQAVAENAGSVIVSVSRVNGSDGEITVNYQTQDGSAKAGSDYNAKSGELVFIEGETSKTISIAILNNSTVDGSRSFQVNLSGNNLGATTSTNVTITDDDQTPPPTDSGSSGGGGSFGLWLLGWLGWRWLTTRSLPRKAVK